jgi:transposase
MVTGILWLLRTGIPWRDLPERYGPWRTVVSRFYRWGQAGIWQRLFDVVQQQTDVTGQSAATEPACRHALREMCGKLSGHVADRRDALIIIAFEFGVSP